VLNATLPVSIVKLKALLSPFLKVITLAETDAVIRALEADVLRLVIDVFALLVNVFMLLVKLFILLVNALNDAVLVKLLVLILRLPVSTVTLN
jgi:hypothetical protein